jgi:succinate dehydrogenase/fumarate reductase-like Fe-S protein
MPQPSTRLVSVRVRRGADDQRWWDNYEVPVEAGQSVLGVLQHIYDNLDPTLTFACSCRIGFCSACLVRVNGKAVRACTTLAEGDMVIEPYEDDAVVRDLVVRLPSLIEERAPRPDAG